MLKVFQVVQHLRPGGLENMVLDIQQFSDFNQNTWIVSLEGELETAIAAWPKLKHCADRLIFMNKQPGLTASTYHKLCQLFTEHQPDVVHTHHIGPLFYASTAAKHSGVKVRIHTEHDAWHLDDMKQRLIQKCALKIANPILIADGHAVAASLDRYLGLDKVKTIHNGIDTNKFFPGSQHKARRSLGLPLDVKFIGCSGRMELVKNQELLIYAMRYLPEDVHLALAGHGSCFEALKYRTLVEGLSHRVHFVGFTDNMPDFYRALDLFCLPSLNEGFPLAPLEAQACNIRALVTDVGGAKETLCPESGKLLPSHHAKEAAELINTMLNGKMSISPRNFITRHFDVREMAKAYDDVCHQGYRDTSTPLEH
ncbi:glycosyltransferase [Shewanella sp. SNU WT4]|uniref:glycosyltransferase n=1 Tax=Shewanella sp. SNU WT4 TaxID=2590015 RepID=UPI00112CB868|nr:glycosyltransferase [Shewanella sp. SNU WT4]QDF68143.1 glycosyltransferase [Shewanella sp. SNU WT4]